MHLVPLLLNLMATYQHLSTYSMEHFLDGLIAELDGAAPIEVLFELCAYRNIIVGWVSPK